MEMEVNEQYKKLINLIKEVRDEGRLNTNLDDKLKTVEVVLTNMGLRPVLPANVQQFMDITTDMAKTYAAKNHDYGNSFGESLDEFGLIASIVRINDKMNRIKSLIKKKAEVKDETIQDTLLDMANYCIMTVMWMNKTKKE